MIYSSWDIEQNILKLVILGHFFFALLLPKNPKNQNFGKWKNLLEISSFYTCAPNHSDMMYGSWDMEWDRQKFLSFWVIFHPFAFPPNDPEYQNFKKKMKQMPGDIILLCIHVCHKWRSYDIWFLKYKVGQTKPFDILGHFLPFQPLDNMQKSKFNIEKNTWRYYHFTYVYHK